MSNLYIYYDGEEGAIAAGIMIEFYYRAYEKNITSTKFDNISMIRIGYNDISLPCPHSVDTILFLNYNFRHPRYVKLLKIYLIYGIRVLWFGTGKEEDYTFIKDIEQKLPKEAIDKFNYEIAEDTSIPVVCYCYMLDILKGPDNYDEKDVPKYIMCMYEEDENE